MLINREWQCSCGELKGIKFRGMRCRYCGYDVYLREVKLKENSSSKLLNLFAEIILYVIWYIFGKNEFFEKDNYMSNTVKNGKGSNRRPEDYRKVSQNWDSINWGKKEEVKPPQKIEDLKNKEMISEE